VNRLSRRCSSVRVASSVSPAMVKAPTGVVSLGGPRGAVVVAWVAMNRCGDDGAESWLSGGGKVIVGVSGGFIYRVEGPSTCEETAANRILSLIRRFSALVMILATFFLRKIFDFAPGWG
jgi:hypothetical protein